MNFLKTVIITIFSVTLFPHLAIAEMKLTSKGIVDGKINKIHACSKKGGKDYSFNSTQRRISCCFIFIYNQEIKYVI